jgi:hypothetical protein
MAVYEITLKIPVRGLVSDGEADLFAESLLAHLSETYEVKLSPMVYVRHNLATYTTRRTR